jgi:O-acetyl-ADP-ribose deacetylase (regulator of RNase III)
MIYTCAGDIMLSHSNHVAHGCNMLGVMGAGIAKTISNKYPLLYKQYKEHCDSGKMKPGSIYVYQSDEKPPKYVFNMITQEGFYNAKLEYIDICLKKIVKNYMKWNIKTLALPVIGSGLGGLTFKECSNTICDALKDAPFDTFLYTSYIQGKRASQENVYYG